MRLIHKGGVLQGRTRDLTLKQRDVREGVRGVIAQIGLCRRGLELCKIRENRKLSLYLLHASIICRPPAFTPPLAGVLDISVRPL